MTTEAEQPPTTEPAAGETGETLPPAEGNGQPGTDVAAPAPAPRLPDPMEIGHTLATSGYFNDAREAAQAAVKVLAGQELGLGPVASMTGIYFFKGKITVGANILAGLVKRAPNYRYVVTEHTDDVCEIEFHELVPGGEWRECGPASTFTTEDAAKAGLLGKDNWKHYPRNMLFARALSNGVRWYCADLTGGQPVYTLDEVGADVDAAGEAAKPPESAIKSRPKHSQAKEAQKLDDQNRELMERLDFSPRKIQVTHDNYRTLPEKRELHKRLEAELADQLEADGS